jgi:hypothetical protein
MRDIKVFSDIRVEYELHDIIIRNTLLPTSLAKKYMFSARSGIKVLATPAATLMLEVYSAKGLLIVGITII